MEGFQCWRVDCPPGVPLQPHSPENLTINTHHVSIMVLPATETCLWFPKTVLFLLWVMAGIGVVISLESQPSS